MQTHRSPKRTFFNSIFSLPDTIVIVFDNIAAFCLANTMLQDESAFTFAVFLLWETETETVLPGMPLPHTCKGASLCKTMLSEKIFATRNWAVVRNGINSMNKRKFCTLFIKIFFQHLHTIPFLSWQMK